MYSLEKKASQRNVSAKGKRFYTALDMAIAKKDAATKNAEIKRGERVDKPNNIVVMCGCGGEGCFMHREFNNPNVTENI